MLRPGPERLRRLLPRLPELSAGRHGQAHRAEAQAPTDPAARTHRWPPSTRPSSTSSHLSAPPDTTGSRGNAQSTHRITGINKLFSATEFWGGLLHNQKQPKHTSERTVPLACACGQETGADTGHSTCGGREAGWQGEGAPHPTGRTGGGRRSLFCRARVAHLGHVCKGLVRR